MKTDAMHRRDSRPKFHFLLMGILLLLFLTTCAGWPSSKRPLARFDSSHGEIFSVFGDGPLDYTAFGQMMREAGFDVIEPAEPITDTSLKNLRLLVIAGPTRPYEHREVQTIRQFVEDGGRLLVLLHIAPPVARLTETFGIFVSNFVVSEHEGSIGGKAQDFYVTRFIPHPVATDVSRIAVFGSWGLMAEAPAVVVAETSDDAWVDFDRNGLLNSDEPRQSFGILAVVKYGDGRMVVVADDAPFATRFLDEGDNRKLAENIVHWLK